MAIWIYGLPLPPSVNTYLKANGYRVYKSTLHKHYRRECELWAKTKGKLFEEIVKALHAKRNEEKALGHVGAFRVDTFLAMNSARFAISDVDNRLKALRDALSACTGIDDRYFYSGNCEKVEIHGPENECAVVRIESMRPRSLSDIRDLMTKELNLPAAWYSACVQGTGSSSATRSLSLKPRAKPKPRSLSKPKRKLR